MSRFGVKKEINEVVNITKRIPRRSFVEKWMWKGVFMSDDWSPRGPWDPELWRKIRCIIAIAAISSGVR